MPRKQGVAYLALGALLILAVVGSFTLLDHPEPEWMPEAGAGRGTAGTDDSAILRAHIADLERRLREAKERPAPPAVTRKEEPARPGTVADILDQAMRLGNTEKNAPDRLRLFREVLTRSTDPDDRARAHYNIAMIYSVQGKKADMAESLERAIRTGAEHPTRTLAAYPLACELYSRGDVRGALDVNDEFLSGPKLDRYWTAAAEYHRGKWLAELGETDRAVAALRDYLKRTEGLVDRYNDAAVKAARRLLASLDRN